MHALGADNFTYEDRINVGKMIANERSQIECETSSLLNIFMK